MQKFQDLLTEAAQLKQQQLKQERKNFQALPQYLKSGLNYAKKYVQLRKQHYLIQKYVSQKLKKQGNDQYLLQNYGQALSKYQQALSVFRFIHATKYQNLKDEDIIYENYKPEPQHKEQHQAHLVALYLNICSALTKMNKKDEAIHASDQALKINDSNAKTYYKKAQAYLQYINRQSSDVKVGFYYLNKAYELSKDQSILAQMHKIKKELDEQRQKQKKWFKFMFDKNKQSKDNSKEQNKQSIKPIEKDSSQKQTNSSAKQNKPSADSTTKQKKNLLNSDVNDFLEQVKTNQSHQNYQEKTTDIRNNRLKQQFQKFRQQNQDGQQRVITQAQKLQKSKLTLKPYLIIPRDDRWLIKYQQDFIHKHGSKIYSILQLYNYSDYLIEFKSLLAKCLQLKQAKITPQRDDNKLLEEKIQMYNKFIDWMKKHPIEKYKRYIERYELQTKWIENNRGKPLDQVYPKESNTQKKKTITNPQQAGKQRFNQFLESVRQTHQRKNENQTKAKQQNKKINEKIKQKHFVQEMYEKEEEIKKKPKTKQNENKPKQKNAYNTYGFKQQWQCNDEDSNSTKEDEVPPNLKGFLQNYEDFPGYQSKLRQKKNKQQKAISDSSQRQKKMTPQEIEQKMQQLKQSPFSFIKTFIAILALTLLVKLIF